MGGSTLGRFREGLVDYHIPRRRDGHVVTWFGSVRFGSWTTQAFWLGKGSIQRLEICLEDFGVVFLGKIFQF